MVPMGDEREDRTSTRVRILLLGPPRVEENGVPVRIERRKAIGLLAYLAATARGATRDELATLLWPEVPGDRAHAYLRQALWVLHRTSVGAWLKTTSERVALVPRDDLWVDVVEFRRSIAGFRRVGSLNPQTFPEQGRTTGIEVSGSLDEAVGLYDGDFLSGFALEDSASFDEWHQAEAEALRQDLAWALDRLSVAGPDARSLDAGITYARRWLCLTPLDEAAHRRLIELLALCGRRGEAIEHYESCAKILEKELRLKPSEETTDLLLEITEGRLRKLGDKAASTPPHNLPAETVPFVGREEELACVSELLARPTCRLVTLVGTGGNGKTRLAVEAARRLLPSFPDGAFLVALAPIAAPEFLVPAIASALRAPFFRETGADSDSREPVGSLLVDQLIDFLRGRRLLLVLDNLEHLLSGVAPLEELLRGAPDLKILTTSRERLKLDAEWVVEVRGLPFPEEGATPREARDYGAVRLFLDAAGRARGTPLSSQEEILCASRIARLVDGMPLGIVLAAAWAGTLSAAEIAAEIETNLDFLSSQSQNAPPKHQSLRAVFDHSWRLLCGPGRAAFRKLAVFHGGFTREAALEVAGADLSGLASLVDKSLLRRLQGGRYEMLEVLRQYAEERLLAVPREKDLVRDRHAQHYVGLLGRLTPALEGEGLKAALDALAREFPNLQAAWLWAAARGEVNLMAPAARGFFLFFDIASRPAEGAQLSRVSASALPLSDDPAAVDLYNFLLACQAWFSRYSAEREARALLLEAVRALEPLGPSDSLAFARVLCGFERMWEAPEEAKPALESSLTFYEQNHDLWGTATTLEALAGASIEADPVAAEALARRSLALRRRIRDPWGVALACHALALTEEAQGQYTRARDGYQTSLALRRKLGLDPDGAASDLGSLGRIARQLGDPSQARRVLGEALATAQMMGNRRHTAFALQGLGLAALDLGDRDAAVSALSEAAALWQAIGARARAAFVLAILARIASGEGNLTLARTRCEEGLASRTDDPWALLELGRLAGLQGERGEASACLALALRQAMSLRERPVALEILAHWAELQAQEGAFQDAAELLGFVLARPGLDPLARRQADLVLTKARATLGPEAVQAALDRGAGLSLDEAATRLPAPQRPTEASPSKTEESHRRASRGDRKRTRKP